MNRSIVLLAAVLAAACSRRAEPQRPSAGAVIDKPAVLATLPEEGPTSMPATSAGLGLHPTALAATPEFTFSELGGGVAWAEERQGKFRVFHNGREGRPYDAVGRIAVSPDGRRCAFGALRDGKWRMVVDGEEGTPFNTVQEPIFSPDGAHLAYVAMQGERWHVVVDGKANAGTAGRYGKLVFSGDSTRVAFVEEAEGEGPRKLVVAGPRLEPLFTVEGSVSDFVVNGAGTRIAAIVRGEDSWRVVSFSFDAPGEQSAGAGYDAAYGVAFGSDGASVTFRGVRGTAGFVVLDGKEEPFAGDGVVSQTVAPGGKELGALVESMAAVRFRRHFARARDEEGPFDEAEGLVYSADGRVHAYAARAGESWSVVVNGKTGPAFDRVVTPLFSPDGSRVVYRARKDGKRFVVVADTNGKTIRQHPSYEQVFPVIFTADGKSVAYGVKDGRQLAWKVEVL